MSSDEESTFLDKARMNPRTSVKLVPLLASLSAISTALLLLSGISNAQNQDDPRDLLLHARENVLDTIERLPRYMCTQLVERSRYQQPNPEKSVGTTQARSCDDTVAEAKRTNRARRLFSTDRLRFDVAVSASSQGEVSEMYSWAGEEHFGDRDLFDFVHDGSISTGSFSSMLATIFGSNAASFSYNGDSVVNGRMLSEFGFRIAQEKSRYIYVFGNGPTQHTTMAFDGTVLVDPQTAELIRLVIRTDQLPAETGACELTQTLEYGRVRLHAADFLLPMEARVSVVHIDGSEAENRIQYSSCREFRSKSVIRFPVSEQTETQLSNGSSPPPSLSLPSGLPFKVVFTDPINTATAAAGDPIRGRLETAIRDGSSNILVPQGTAVIGRIMSIRRYYDPSNPAPDSKNKEADSSWATILVGPQAGKAENRTTADRQPPLVLKIKLEKLDLGGNSFPLNVAFDSGLHRFAKSKGQLPKRVEIGSIDSSQDLNTGSFAFWETKPNYVVRSGLESNWVTLSP
jgi:hypothetical protein